MKLTASEQVSAHIQQLSPALQPAIEYLRQLMLSIDPMIAEHIKWNSPAFYYAGEMKPFAAKEYKRDILVMNLRNDQITCVLPTGMSIQQNTAILEGDYTDGRRMIRFQDLSDIQAKEAALRATIQEWLDMVEKAA